MNAQFRPRRGVFQTISRRLSPAARRLEREDGVALVSAVLFMVMLAGLSLVLLAVLLGQFGPAYAAQKSSKTVYTAQAGLQAGLGSIRAATKTDATGAKVGDRSKLICSLTGSADGTGAGTTYNVSIRYYLSDPTGKSDSWLASNALPCTASGVSTQPSFAYVVSRGQGPSAQGRNADEGNRALSATYSFRVTNVNIPGGRVFNFDKTRCLQARVNPGGNVVPNAEIEFVTGCSTNDARQLWIYDENYRLVLASSTLTAPKLCVTSATNSSGPIDGRATLEQCKGNGDAARYPQLFAWEGDHSWYVSNKDISSGRSGKCLRNTSNYLATGACSPFAPAPSVGAGAASAGTQQIVNYQEFGRCLDVTDQDINKSFMISYPCKQAPSGNPNHLNWNHKWYYTEATDAQVSRVGTISVRVDNSTSKTYCLQTPASGSSSKYPTFKSCTGSPATQQWTRIKNTGEYANSYVFTDTYGRCLQANGDDKYNQWSRIVVAACDGGLDQKWNAPSIAYDSTFGGFKELGE